MPRSSTTAREGNSLALKYGARSPRVISQRTDEIVAAWQDPDTGLKFAEPVDAAAIYATASAYARLCEIVSYLETDDGTGKARGALDSRGRPRGAMRIYFTAYREVMSGLRQLGATPSGRAEMAAGVVAGIRNARAAQDAQKRLRSSHARDVSGDTT